MRASAVALHPGRQPRSIEDQELLDAVCATVREGPEEFREAGEYLDRRYSKEAVRSREVDKMNELRAAGYPERMCRLETSMIVGGENAPWPRVRLGMALAEEFEFLDQDQLTIQKARVLLLLPWLVEDRATEHLQPHLCEFQGLPWYGWAQLEQLMRAEQNGSNEGQDGDWVGARLPESRPDPFEGRGMHADMLTPERLGWVRQALSIVRRSASRRPPPPTVEECVPAEALARLRGRVTHQEIAGHYGLDPEAVRKRLERWRKKNFEGWSEVADRPAGSPKYIYDATEIASLFERGPPDEQ